MVRLRAAGFWLAGLTAVAAALAGCGDSIKHSKTPNLVIDPAQFVFPKLSVGSNADQTVTLSNTGQGTLIIKKVVASYGTDGQGEFRLDYKRPGDDNVYDGIGLDGTDQFAAQGLYPLKIAGGDKLILVLNYKPTDDRPPTNARITLQTSIGDKQIPIVISDVGAEINVNPQTLDFGRVSTMESKMLPITVTNLGQVPLDVSDLRVSGSQLFVPRVNGKDPRRVHDVLGDPDGDGQPGLAPRASFQIEVTYQPDSQSPDRGQLKILSSDASRPEIAVNLTANGATPCLRVVPAAVEFPSSLVNRTDSRQFSIESCGGEALEIYDIQRLDGADGSDAFSVQVPDNVTLPAALPAVQDGMPSPSVAITANFEPHEQRIYNGTIGIFSNDPTGEPTPLGDQMAYLHRVSLLGRGVLNACPQARVSQDEFYVQPLDVVSLDGGPSIDQDGPNNKPVEYKWVVINSPQGSQSVPGEALLNPADPGVGVREDDPSTPTAVFWADLVGTYTLQLRVRDNLGLGSDQCDTAIATVTIVAKPDQAIHLQLTWRTPNDPDVTDREGTDLDLHLRHPNADGWFTAPYDCYYYNPTPDWGQLENPDDDPTIDIDDIDGNGPENISLNSPESTDQLGGEYMVGVHYYRSTDRRTNFDFGPSFAKLRIFINGELAWDYTADGDPGEKEMQAVDHFWEAASIAWPSGTVTKIDNYLEQRP
jgi:hypothetical protein